MKPLFSHRFMGSGNLTCTGILKLRYNPTPLKSIRSLGQKTHQRVTRISPPSDDWGNRDMKHFTLSHKIQTGLCPSPHSFPQYTASSYHCSLSEIGFSCNLAHEKYFYFLNYELHSKETYFKAELYINTSRHQGNILMTGSVSWGNNIFGNAAHSFRNRAAGAHSKCVLIHTGFLSNGLWRQNTWLSFKWAESHLKAYCPSVWELTQLSYRQRLFITVAWKSLFKFLLLL